MTEVQPSLTLATMLAPPSSSVRLRPLSWRAPRRDDQLTTVQVHEIQSWGTTAVDLLRSAGLREAKILLQQGRRLRPTVQRLPAEVLRPGARARCRAALASGVVLHWPRHAAEPTVLEEVLGAAGASTTDLHPVLTTGGCVLVRCQARGQEAVLRLAPSGTVADPAPGGNALQRLAADPGGPVPRFLGSGLLYDVSWVLEEARPGTRPLTLSESLLEDVVGFLSGLPRSTGGRPVGRLLDVLTSLMPDWVPAAEELTATIARELDGWPSVAAHGDFWNGNLLERAGRLSGVVDWDAYDPLGVPGGDLLHLVATEERLRTRTSMGSVYRSAPWLRETFRSRSRDYYRALGLEPSPAQLTAVGTSWWAAQTAGDLRRRPELSRNASWVAANLTSVLAPHR